jgi:hypothetical protein
MSERAPTGTGTMDKNAAMEINIASYRSHVEKMADWDEALGMEAKLNKEANIEAYSNSQEVSELNDRAMISMFGTNGKTEGYVDPATGQPLKAPVKGLVEEVREHPKLFGFNSKLKPGDRGHDKEREGFAKDVEQDFMKLVNEEGLEPCQAEVVVRGWLGNRVFSNKYKAKLLADGESAAEAEEKTWGTKDKPGVYRRKNQRLLDNVKEEGIFSQDDYDTVFVNSKKVKDLYEDGGPRDKNNNKNNKNKLKTPEYQFPNAEPIYYRPREDGKVQVAIEVETPNSKLELDKHKHTNNPNKRLVLVSDTNGNEYLIKGDQVFDMDASRKANKQIRFPLKNTTLVTGEVWKNSGGLSTSAEIDTVEVGIGEINKGEETKLPKAFQLAGQDPFERLQKELDAIKAGGTKPPTPPTRRRFERLRSRKAKGAAALAVVALAAAGVGAAVFASKAGEDHPNSGKPAAEKQVGGKAGDGSSNKKAAAGGKESRNGSGKGGSGSGNSNEKRNNHRRSHAHRAGAGALKHSVVLNAGDNPWTVSRTQLEKHMNRPPTNAEIAQYDAELAHANGDSFSLAEDDHRDEHLPVGTRLKLPRR